MDQRLRQLERRAAQGDAEAARDLLRERWRCGELREEGLRLAAALGHVGASALFPEIEPLREMGHLAYYLADEGPAMRIVGAVALLRVLARSADPAAPSIGRAVAVAAEVQEGGSLNELPAAMRELHESAHGRRSAAWPAYHALQTVFYAVRGTSLGAQRGSLESAFSGAVEGAGLDPAALRAELCGQLVPELPPEPPAGFALGE